MTETDPWAERAACVGHDPRLWDPSDNSSRPTRATHERRKLAASICSTCPVINQCAAATTITDAGMIRAGRLVTYTGRLDRLRDQLPPARRRDLAPCGTPAAAERHRRHGERCTTCRVGLRTTAPCRGESARARHRRRNESCFVCWPDTGRPRAYNRAS